MSTIVQPVPRRLGASAIVNVLAPLLTGATAFGFIEWSLGVMEDRGEDMSMAGLAYFLLAVPALAFVVNLIILVIALLARGDAGRPMAIVNGLHGGFWAFTLLGSGAEYGQVGTSLFIAAIVAINAVAVLLAFVSRPS